MNESDFELSLYTILELSRTSQRKPLTIKIEVLGKRDHSQESCFFLSFLHPFLL
jgi:hypothetical protein